MFKKIWKTVTKPIKKVINKVAKALGPKGMKALAIASTLFTLGSMAGFWGPAAKTGTVTVEAVSAETAKELGKETVKEGLKEAGEKAAEKTLVKVGEEAAAESLKKKVLLEKGSSEIMEQALHDNIKQQIVNSNAIDSTMSQAIDRTLEPYINGSIDFTKSGAVKDKLLTTAIKPTTPDTNIFQRIFGKEEGVIKGAQDVYRKTLDKPFREIFGGKKFSTTELRQMNALQRTAVNASPSDVLALNTVNNFINPPTASDAYPGGADVSSAINLLQDVNTPASNVHGLDAANLATTNVKDQKSLWSDYSKVVSNVTGIDTRGWSPSALMKNVNVFGATPDLIASHAIGGFNFAK